MKQKYKQRIQQLVYASFKHIVGRCHAVICVYLSQYDTVLLEKMSAWVHHFVYLCLSSLFIFSRWHMIECLRELITYSFYSNLLTPICVFLWISLHNTSRVYRWKSLKSIQVSEVFSSSNSYIFFMVFCILQANNYSGRKIKVKHFSLFNVSKYFKRHIYGLVLHM